MGKEPRQVEMIGGPLDGDIARVEPEDLLVLIFPARHNGPHAIHIYTRTMPQEDRFRFRGTHRVDLVPNKMIVHGELL